MTAWLSYLHNLRAREIEIIFRGCPPGLFEKGLELGAGDGFQAGLLSNYTRKLVCTDFNGVALKDKERIGSVEYRVCDAELVEMYFPRGEFDLVYSSNLLEHLPRPGLALQSMHRVLKDDGVTVHVVPTPFWKVCHLACFYPDLAHRTVRAFSNGNIFRKTRRNGREKKLPNQVLGNNPKMPARCERTFCPAPHGAYRSNFGEFYAFSKRRWLKEFCASGFQVLKVLRGPVSSGYGFGLDGIRWILERASVSSEYVYVAVKKGQASPYAQFF